LASQQVSPSGLR